MLKHLYISQYALIDELELSLENGFSVITGETGAGKSIIMGALALVMGARADSKSVREGAQKCVVEAQFLMHNVQCTMHNVFRRGGYHHLENLHKTSVLPKSIICLQALACRRPPSTTFDVVFGKTVQ
jgi:DNA repair ATPase RecN